MTLRDHLQAVYEEHGRLTPELVRETARPKDHPLHAHVFDRAPKDAAEAWYLTRAHELIQRVKITYKTGPKGEEHSIRVFHAVRTEKGHSYEPVETIVNDPFLRRLVLADMEREWKQLKSRYGHFAEFVAMVAEEVKAA